MIVRTDRAGTAGTRTRYQLRPALLSRATVSLAPTCDLCSVTFLLCDGALDTSLAPLSS